MISLIVAHSKNNVIGKDGQLPWHISDDLKRFKELTTGHPIIMGRKTFESIGRALPNRRNIVVSRQNDFHAENITVVGDIRNAINLVEDEDEAFIIGGGEIYKQSLKFADKVYVTYVDEETDGDAYFPELNLDNWQLEKLVPNRTNDGLKYYFADFVRRDSRPQLYLIDQWRSLEQVLQMEDLEKRGVCVFCERHFKSEHREPIEVETSHWVVTKNDYPYANTSLHLLVIPKEHVGTFADLSQKAQNDFGKIIAHIEDHYRLTSYSQFMRVGDFRYTGGSIFHLHGHILVPDHSNPSYEGIRVKLGSKPKEDQSPRS